MKNCTEEFPISKKDLEEYTLNRNEPSEKMLCYLKCNAENDDMIFEDGSLNMNFLKAIIDRSTHMSTEEKEKVEECLSKVPLVRNCNDFESFTSCVLNMNLF